MAKIIQDGKLYLFGKYLAIVRDVEDPEFRGRVLVKLNSSKDVPGLFWAEPCLPSNEVFTIPRIGAQIWIEFQEGDMSKAIWVGCKPKKQEANEVAKDKNRPLNRSIQTERNLQLNLNDLIEEIQLKTPNTKLTLNNPNKKIVLDTDTIEIGDGGNTKIILKKVGSSIVIDAEIIKIGEGANQSIVLGDSFKTLFNSHTHTYIPGGGIPTTTTPPTSPMGSSHLSAKHKVE